VVAGTATAVSGRVALRQQQNWSEQDAQAQQAAAPAPAAAAPAAGGDELTQIRTLAGLVDDGILSPEDFVAKVKQIVGA
jgi:hypothetical protein